MVLLGTLDKNGFDKEDFSIVERGYEVFKKLQTYPIDKGYYEGIPS